MTVRQILKTKPHGGVFTITPDTRVADAAKVLSEKGIGALIVSADGVRLDGLLSERDIVRELGRRGPGCLDEPVSNIMTSEVITAEPGDAAVTAYRKMSDGNFRHLPVMDDEQMVGLISIRDVIRHRIEQVEAENSALTDMIAGHG